MRSVAYFLAPVAALTAAALLELSAFILFCVGTCGAVSILF